MYQTPVKHWQEEAEVLKGILKPCTHKLSHCGYVKKKNNKYDAMKTAELVKVNSVKAGCR